LRVHIINIDLTLKKNGYSVCKVDSGSNIQKIIDSLNEDMHIPGARQIDVKKKTKPLPIIQSSLDETCSSYKRFSPKEYIEKHILSSSTSSPDKPFDKMKSLDVLPEANPDPDTQQV
jgi:hypothetical protein